jgi:glutamate-1-semialdehyde 2,1-aminomutase
LAAAIATVQEIKKCNAIEHFWKIGALLCRGIEKVSKEIGADKYIETAGYSVKPSLIIKDEAGLPSLIARTLFMQEMIKKSVLMPYIVPSLAHDEKLIDSVVQKIGDVLVTVKHAAENGGMLKAIDGGVMKPVFRRYN